MQAVADEVSQRAAAVLPVRLPVLDTHPGGVIFDVPINGDMTQAADRTLIQQFLRFSPNRDRGKGEIDHVCPSTGQRGLRHSPGAWQVGGKRLFRKDRFTQLESPNGDRRLQARRCPDRNSINIRMLDQLPPIAERCRNVRGPRNGCGTSDVTTG